ncbi:MAG: N-acetyltransferase [Arenibacter algicola]|nr:N-acetyltransferase [Arenibacter algicola]
MSEVAYFSFDRVDPDDFMEILNEDSLRTHLIDHPYFDNTSLEAWMEEKIKVDSMPGCRIRAVYIDGVLAGWCGIQPDDNGFELAVVLAQKFWGAGLSIFKSLMAWANEMGHEEVLFHLLDSRPEYRALSKIASKVHKTEQLGRCFTSYTIPVNE